ncbi:unnamed protein product, partial [Laminaria digitata]
CCCVFFSKQPPSTSTRCCTMIASPEAVHDCPLSEEIKPSPQPVPPAVAVPSNAAARGDGEIDVEPPLEDDAAELDGENSCSASLVAPSFELTDEPTSPKLGPWGDK